MAHTQTTLTKEEVLTLVEKAYDTYAACPTSRVGRKALKELAESVNVLYRRFGHTLTRDEHRWVRDRTQHTIDEY
ncbi:MAG TPA: hypothetical protein VN843_06760 [Anaerolineales bacterium]|nr:hypothetical protein [Anaerolineales bacterium]